MIPINRPIIEKEEKEAVQKVLESHYLTDASFEGGKFVREFEDLFSKYVGVKHAIAVNSGTSALLAVVLALKLGKRDITLTSGFTFASTATTSLFVGAKVKFADIQLKTYCISVDDIRKKISQKTKILIPVHLYGHPAQMDEINEIAEESGSCVVEDAAQSLGSQYKGRMTGSIGTIGIFSLYATKIVTCGEGGVVATNDDSIAETIRMIRSHGQVKGYDSEILGLNLRLPQIEAAIGTEQLKKLDRFILSRKENAKFFNEEFSKIDGIRTPVEEKYAKTNWSVYTVFVKKKRDDIMSYLRKNGVGATIYYPIPMNKLPVFHDISRLFNCEEAAEHVLSLPVHPSLTQEEKNSVVDIFKQAIKKFL
jgi:perosamine synthetase